MTALADQAAEHFERVLGEGVARDTNIIAVIHVPPCVWSTSQTQSSACSCGQVNSARPSRNSHVRPALAHGVSAAPAAPPPHHRNTHAAARPLHGAESTKSRNARIVCRA
jgi:hypothetical protein